MKKTFKLLTAVLILTLLFSASVGAQLTPLDQTRVHLADDLGLISEAVFMSEQVVEETEFINWTAKTFSSQPDLNGIPADDDSSLQYIEAAYYLTAALDQKEFAESYDSDIETAYWQTAKLLGLFEDFESLPAANAEVNNLDGLKLLITALTRADIHYDALGSLDDTAVYAAAVDNIEEFQNRNLLNSEASQLFELGNTALQAIPDGKFTGYTIKNPIERAIFDYSRTIRYGHASTPHLKQMLSLLKREDYDARAAVESRTSSYIHLIDEWGPPGEGVSQSPISEIRTVVHADEYDLLIEFESRSEMNQFSQLISEYAQKEEEGEKGLIRDSWFVPLFSSKTEVDGLVKVDEVRVEDSGYALLSYTLPAYSEEIKDHLLKIDPNLKVEVNPVWINESFLTYLEVNVD